MLSDTHPDAERVQIELLRRAGPAQRLKMALDLTATAINLSRRAIARANPHFSEHDVNMRWVELTYGKELASGLRKYLGETHGADL
jgi:hypothetical protein